MKFIYYVQVICLDFKVFELRLNKHIDLRDFLRSYFVSDNKTFCIVFDWETYTQ